MKLRYVLLPLVFTIGSFLVMNCYNSNSNLLNTIEHDKVTESTVISKNTTISFSFKPSDALRKQGFYVENDDIITFNIPVEQSFLIDDSFSYDKFNAFSNFIENIIFTDFFYLSVHNQDDITLSRSIYHTYSYKPLRTTFISLYNKNENGDGVNTPLSVQQFSEFKSLALTFATTPESKEFIQGKFDNINSQLMSLAENYYKDLKSGKFFEEESSTRLINFFEVVNSKQSTFPNEVIAKLENKYNTQLNFNTELALHKFKAHYEHVNSINFKEAILDFKYNNFVKMPPNDNDVCFVKIPDNVFLNIHVVGQINFSYSGYTLEPYSCAGGLNIQ